MDWLESKILGCLAGAAAGDAMGAATELRTRRQIAEKFGGYVTDFLTPPSDTFARGNRAGQITDDFSCAYIACRAILENGGKIDTETAKKALLEWAAIDEYFTRFAGPTTRAAVEALRGAAPPAGDFELANDNGKASNGAAMKTAPVALFSGGDVDKAIRDSLTLCRWTHGNNVSLSAAGAVAAATAAAMAQNATLDDVIKAGLYGAQKADELSREAGDKVLASASVQRRIALAVELAQKAPDLSAAMDDISDIIGAGLQAAEAVPAAFGLMAAARGDTVACIEAAVNIGNDTDTIATMAGGILGALNGADSMPAHYLEVVERENDIHLRQMAAEIRALL